MQTSLQLSVSLNLKGKSTFFLNTENIHPFVVNFEHFLLQGNAMNKRQLTYHIKHCGIFQVENRIRFHASKSVLASKTLWQKF